MVRTLACAIAFCIGLGATAPAASAPCAGFTDVSDADAFCAGVTWLRNRGVTQGCTATLYCPNTAVTRLQMAAFLSRMQPMLAPALVDVNGAFAGGLVTAALLSGPASFLAYAANGETFHLPLNVAEDATHLPQFFLQGMPLYYTQPACGGQPYLLVFTGSQPFAQLSPRFGGLATPSPGTDRIYGAIRPAAGAPAVVTRRDPGNGTCVVLLGTTYLAIYEAADLGPFTYQQGLSVK